MAVTAIAALCILIWGVNYLKGTSLFESRTTYYGIYDNVGGLKVSSGVMYRGYQVGQVANISFTGEHYDKVLVEFFLKEDLPLPKNTRAVIQSSDLMGSKVIDLQAGDAREIAQSGDTLVAEMAEDMLAAIGQQVQPLKEKAERVMVSLDSVLTALHDTFNPETRNHLSNSFRHVDLLLANLEKASGELSQLMDGETGHVSRILRNADSITSNLAAHNGEISTMLQNASAITDSLQQANVGQIMARLTNITTQVDSILSKVNRGKGSAGAFVNDDNLYYSLNETVENLNRLLVEFRYNPKRFVRLSLMDFSSSKSEVGDYAVVILESTERLAADSPLYDKHPGLKEIKYKGKYLYIIDSFKKLKNAQRELQRISSDYKEAYIVKIDFA